MIFVDDEEEEEERWKSERERREGGGTNQLRKNPAIPSRLKRLIVIHSVGSILVVLEEDRGRKFSSEGVVDRLRNKRKEDASDFIIRRAMERQQTSSIPSQHKQPKAWWCSTPSTVQS